MPNIYKILIFLFLLIIVIPAQANLLPDMDGDGIPDQDERSIYYTNPDNPDSDGDGFNDWLELNSGFSPYNAEPLKLEDSDVDNDGLSDRMELNFGTNPTVADTDGDGYNDGIEVENAFDPMDPDKILLEKRIEVNLAKQEMSYFLGGVRMGKFKVSSGKNNSTPSGHFIITNKSLKAWSPYGLWMPYWMGLDTGKFGIHELPVWPSGYREGEDHLGIPVSHGCVRVGVGPAEFLYNWAPIGTKVFIY